MHREVFRRFNDERQAHIIERLRDLHTHIERHGARLVVFNHRCPHALLGGAIERWVHHVAREVDITSLDDVERLERDNGQRVFHLAAVGREASRQAHVALLRKAHGEVAATFEVHIVLPVFTQTAAEACSIADGDAQREVESADFQRRVFLNSGRVAEGNKLHEVVQAVVHRQRRIPENVGHVGAVENLEFAADADVVRRSLERSEIVGIDLSIEQRQTVSLGVDELEIVGPH